MREGAWPLAVKRGAEKLRCNINKYSRRGEQERLGPPDLGSGQGGPQEPLGSVNDAQTNLRAAVTSHRINPHIQSRFFGVKM